MAGSGRALASSLAPVSRDGRVQLQILIQPEEQHRTRYQTEGSRGAIKDRTGNGFPTVQLIGYDKPATLQIFIGSGQEKVSPHMFYQACKVSGKSSTPCNEKKVEGTMHIEIEFEPSKEMLISCDCVGILKERNVDVEQRFPDNHATSTRNRSTTCRLIFKTTIINSEGADETLVAACLSTLCTQPPGQPEICKKSLEKCFAIGGEELFIIGKNFLKDTKVMFQEKSAQGQLLWEARAKILKNNLTQNHLICVIPPYKDELIENSVECKMYVCSSGGGPHSRSGYRMSEPNNFTYLPTNGITGTARSGNTSVGAAMDHCSQSQAVVTEVLQQQITNSLLRISMSLPIGRSLSQDTTETFTGNNMWSDESSIQVAELEEAYALHIRSGGSPHATKSMPFSNDLMNATMEEQKSFMSELQSLLDQNSRNALSEIHDENERNGIAQPNLNIGTSSFMTQNLGDARTTLGNITYSNSAIMTTQQSVGMNFVVKAEPQIQSGGPVPNSMMNSLGSDMKQNDGLPAVSQMSDNELLSYMSPDYFDHDMKCC